MIGLKKQVTLDKHISGNVQIQSVSVHRSTGSIIKLKKEKMTVHHLQKTSMA